MASRYPDLSREPPTVGIVSRLKTSALLLIISAVGMASAGVYWGVIQYSLTGNWHIAITTAIILVVSPPVLFSFLLPHSSGSILLERNNMRRWGGGVALLCAAFFLWYVVEVQYRWWSRQPAAADAGVMLHQVGIWLIGGVIIPGLVLAQATSEELLEEAHQKQVVQHYRLQAQADIAHLRAQLLRARQLTLKGFANLIAEEREELASALVELVRGIDGTLDEYTRTIRAVSETMLPFEGLADNLALQEYLDYLAESIASANRPVRKRRQRWPIEQEQPGR
ncbi:MAG: hypothetical protein HC884_09805 [Chloroflexaceae bacterium]|nr:hypothetical protein [Chloroflexaceae bacterium]